jgi:ubiquinone/menaquinone biosynthesis C-methylase UbiE
MGFFNWAAPMFHRADRRWTLEDVSVIANRLRPALNSGGHLLDVGGGTGRLSSLLARALDAHATVLDASPQMLRYAESESRVITVLGRAESMPFPSASFDAALVTDALHHFRDQPGAFAELARVVRPGGRVLVLDLDREARGMWIAIWGERLLGEPSAFLTPEELRARMAENGILGESTRERAMSYRFLGEVKG